MRDMSASLFGANVRDAVAGAALKARAEKDLKVIARRSWEKFCEGRRLSELARETGIDSRTLARAMYAHGWKAR